MKSLLPLKRPSARDVLSGIFVGAGLGTSIPPLRYGVPPDVWLVTLGPRR